MGVGKEGRGRLPPPPSLDRGEVLPPYSGHPRPIAYILYTLTSNLAPTLK